MIFIDNKYTKWYYGIITNAKTRDTVNGYVERHHIIPKSLGGTNFPDNLVVLTPREHFICHWLLIKMLPDKGNLPMIYALNVMQRRNRTQVRYTTKTTSRVYSRIREEFAIRHSENMKGVNAGKKRPDLSERNRLTKTGEHPWNYGIKTGPQSDERRAITSAALKGILKGRKKPTIICPHCQCVGAIGNMNRWHFNNCKMA